MSFEINYKAIWGFLIISFVLILIMGITLSSGCLSMSKSVIRDVTATPEPTPTPAPPTPEPTHTPTPEPTLSKEQFMSTYGGLPMGQWLNYNRENVSGYKDLNVHVTVYGYRMFPKVDWYSVSWGQYFPTGAGEGKKFLFVFVNMWSDPESPRQWIMDKDHWYVQIGDQLYPSTEERLMPQFRIHQLDEVWDLDHRTTIQPYGYLRTYNSEKLPIAVPEWFLTPGRSNAQDGYIVYHIPYNTTPEEIRVLFQGDNLARQHWWQLAPQTNKYY